MGLNIICIKCNRDTKICLDKNDTDCERGEHCLCDDAGVCYGHCSGCHDPVDYCLTAGQCVVKIDEEAGRKYALGMRAAMSGFEVGEEYSPEELQAMHEFERNAEEAPVRIAEIGFNEPEY